MMRAHFRLRVSLFGLVVVLLGTAISALAQNNNLPLPPRGQAPKGIPDLSGVWLESTSRLSMEAGLRRALGGKPLEEAIPFTAFGLQQWKSRDLSKDPTGFCQPSGMARILHSPLNMQIVQTEGQVTFLFELYSQFTRVFTDGRKMPQDLFPTWWGYSIGRYEGDKLIVETQGLDERSWIASAGLQHSNQLKHTATFQLKPGDPETLVITETFEDPVYFTKQWGFSLERKRDKYDMILHVCTDNIRTLYDMMLGMFPQDDEK
jgi:hypothetical protein